MLGSFLKVLNLWCRKALSTRCDRQNAPRYSCVESLMPKGVEHFQDVLAAAEMFKCWISDAERRWAHRCKYQYRVTKMCWISDAERRWALLLIIGNTKICKCWISDAERRWARLLATTIAVSADGVESLMPKGVEHYLDSVVTMLR